MSRPLPDPTAWKRSEFAPIELSDIPSEDSMTSLMLCRARTDAMMACIWAIDIAKLRPDE